MTDVEKAMYEARKKLIIRAIQDLKEVIPFEYVLTCPDTSQWIKVVVKFKDPENSSLYSIDFHDYVYTKYKTDPKVFVIDKVSPMTRVELLENCELVFGDESSVKKDLELAKDEAERFSRQIEEVRRLYSKGS